MVVTERRKKIGLEMSGLGGSNDNWTRRETDGLHKQLQLQTQDAVRRRLCPSSADRLRRDASDGPEERDFLARSVFSRVSLKSGWYVWQVVW